MSDTYSVFDDGERTSGLSREKALKKSGPGVIVAREEADGPKEPTVTPVGVYVVSPPKKKANGETSTAKKAAEAVKDTAKDVAETAKSAVTKKYESPTKKAG